MNKTRVISHNSIHPCPKHKACSGPSPHPSLCPDALSPVSRTERLANSFRQAWDQGCIQAGSAPCAARSGRQTRATARKQPLLPRTLIHQPQGLPSHGNPRNITLLSHTRDTQPDNSWNKCNKLNLVCEAYVSAWTYAHSGIKNKGINSIISAFLRALFEVAMN